MAYIVSVPLQVLVGDASLFLFPRTGHALGVWVAMVIVDRLRLS